MPKKALLSFFFTSLSLFIAFYWFTLPAWIIAFALSAAALLVHVKNLPQLMKTFTGYKQPRADKFRIDDLWCGPEGRTYRVKKGFGDHVVKLIPLSYNVPIYMRDDSVRYFRRIKWGGQP